MSRWKVTALALVAGFLLNGLPLSEARAQYSAISAPFGSAGHSYYENIGIGWAVRGSNFFFNNGGAASALPPFGGYDPGADGRFGFTGRSGNTNFSFNIFAGQGSSRTLTSETPTVVVPNGGTGAIFDGRQQPFVTGFAPVVGGLAPPAIPFTTAPHAVSPLAQRLSRLRAEQAMQAQSAAAQNAPEQADPPSRSAPPSLPQKDDPPLVLGVK